MRTEVRGYCRDCRFRRQEWAISGDRMVIDRFCDVFDVFVPEDGYCHAWEHETVL